MHGHAADRNLLFGILALQMDLITREALIAAMGAWALSKGRSIGEILVEAGALEAVDRADLEPMIDRRLAREGGDPAKGLAALSSASSIVAALRRSIADPDVLGSLAHVSEATQGDPFATKVPGAIDQAHRPVRYRKVRDHAEGGLGVVFVARDEELNREVALKEIKPRFADNPASRSRFLLEAEITGGLEHPGIVPVYGLGHHDDGRPFYAMRFIKGDSLRDAIAAFHADEGLKDDPGARTLALQKLLRRFLDVCNAVAYAHSRGVLHRDLKPDNVMVGRYGETLVVDWGLAKAVGRSSNDPDSLAAEATLVPDSGSGSDETLPGSVIGTPAYMSPEQAAGRLDLLGPSSDVYSLGATLYALLTGNSPFAGKDAAEVIRRVERGGFSRPRDSTPWLDPALEAICLKAMALRPGGRYPSPRSLAEDLERWIADEPVTAHLESTGRRLRRWAKRNLALVSGAASLLVTAVVVLSIANVQIDAKRAEADEQSRLRGVAVVEKSAALGKAEQAATLAEAAEKRASAESTRAKDEAAKVVGVISLLVNTFRANDPIGWEGLGLRMGSETGQTLTAREILDRSARLVEQALADQPLVRATLMDTIGDVYHSMGELDRAAPLIEGALKVRDGLLGPDDPELATSLVHLGRLKQDWGDLDGAERDYREGFARRARRFGEESPEALGVKSLLGVLWLYEVESDKAESTFREVIEKLGKVIGDDRREVAIARLGLSAALLEKGQFTEAVIQSTKALKVILSKEHAEQFLLTIGKFQLAFTFNNKGQHQAAERLFRDCYQGVQDIVGRDHPYLAFLDLEIARARESRGDDVPAEASYRRCLDLLRKSGTICQPRSRNVVDGLGLFLSRKGRFDEAMAFYEEYLKACRDRYGDGHIWVADALVLLAQIPQLRGDFDEHLRLLREALAIYRGRKDHFPVNLTACLNALANELQRRGESGEAEPLYREALPLARKQWGDRSEHVAIYLSNLAKCLMSQGRFDEEVVKLADEAHRTNPTSLSGNPTLAAITRSNLASLAYRHGELGRAESLAREAWAAASRGFPGQAARRIGFATSLAGVLAARGRTGEAMVLMDGLMPAMIRDCPENPPDLLSMMSTTALLRRVEGNFGGYRALLAEMPWRFLPGIDAGRLTALTWALARFDDPAEDPTRLEELGRRVLAATPENSPNRLIGSVALLRAGRVEEASRLLEAFPTDPKFDSPLRDLYLAIAYRRLDRPDEARAADARATAWIKRPEKFTRSWNLSLELRVLQGELDRLSRDHNAELPRDVFAP